MKHIQAWKVIKILTTLHFVLFSFVDHFSWVLFALASDGSTRSSSFKLTEVKWALTENFLHWVLY